MPHIRLNLEKKADRNVRIYMAKHDITDKREAINEILKKFKV